MSTNVPLPTFGPNGFIAPPESEILAGVQADINAAFGGNLNMDPTTPQGQLAVSIAAIIGNIYDTFLFYTQQMDPSYSTGRMQDGLARIYFIERDGATPTTLIVACNGGLNVGLPVGTAQIVDDSGNVYSSTESGIIPSSGTIDLEFACNTPGPIAIPESVTIFQAIPGWDSATVVGGEVGTNTETRAAFEQRRANSVANNSVNSLDSILGAVLAVNGVTDAYVTENFNTTPLTVGGYTLAPNSVFVCAVGGLETEIAQAIWSKKPPGCAMNGNTAITVFDENPAYAAPFPSYQILFQTPDPLPIAYEVTLNSNTAIPSNVLSLVQNALASAFVGGDGGSPAGIGDLLLSTRYIAPLSALGTWAQVVSVQLGSYNTAQAQFLGFISGSTLTVDSMVSGSLAVGQLIMDGSGAVLGGTTIESLGTGTGGTGTYNLSNSQNVSVSPGITLYGVIANQNVAQVGIAQQPTFDPNNVTVNIVTNP